MPHGRVISIEALARKAGRHPPEAYEFVSRALRHASFQVHGPPEERPDEKRHVSGADLCWGLRDLALDRWGLLARTVLEEWNIRTTMDVGRIVFDMIDWGIMHRQEGDTLDDFDDVFDFAQSFEQSYEFEHALEQDVEEEE